jgi:hypothetical protein
LALGEAAQLRFGDDVPILTRAIVEQPAETIIEAEIAALDENGRASFNPLQNYCRADTPLRFYFSIS